MPLGYWPPLWWLIFDPVFRTDSKARPVSKETERDRERRRTWEEKNKKPCPHKKKKRKRYNAGVSNRE